LTVWALFLLAQSEAAIGATLALNGDRRRFMLIRAGRTPTPAQPSKSTIGQNLGTSS
jgi:hypothetical protein